MTTSRKDLRISELGVTEFINCFSLLVVAGSVSTSYFFGQIYKANLGFSFYWLLASTIWIIYTLDHVLDGMKLREESLSTRHLIHYTYRKTILPTLGALVMFNAIVAVAFLPRNMLFAGVVLAVFVGIYFLVVHWLKTINVNLPKELFVAIIVAAGMVILPGISGNMTFSFEATLMVLSMVFVNFTNLLLFSLYDHDNDSKNGLTSAATQWGVEKTKSVILFMLAGAFMSFACWTFLIMSPMKLPISISLLIMFNILLVIFIQDERFAIKERYRFWGDFVFLVPGLVWITLVQKSFF